MRAIAAAHTREIPYLVKKAVADRARVSKLRQKTTSEKTALGTSMTRNLTRAWLFVCLVSSAPLLAAELPAKSFGQLPMVDQPRLSPDGRHVAAILNSEQGPTITVSELDSAEVTPIVRLKYGRDRIDWILWANNDRLLVSVSESVQLTGDKFRVSRLYQVGRDGKGMKQIYRKTPRDVHWWVHLYDTNTILSLLPDEPDKILMQLYDERDEGFAVFKVDIVKNRFDKQFPNTYKVDRWWANNKGEVVLGRQTDEDETTLWYRPEGQDKWQPLHTRKAFEDDTFTPVTINGDKAYVISDYELGREALWRYDIPSGTFEELVFAADKYDLAGALLSPDRVDLLGVYYYDHFRRDHYFDEEAAASARLIEQSFPGLHTSVVSRSSDGNRLMVSALKDNAPPRYIWLDLKQKSGKPWFGPYPSLVNVELPEVKPIEFAASDGTPITGYLTLPLATGDTKPPLVVFPHGGPHARDYQYFDPFVQFFANRGYAVLQVNFRGSEGFGSGFQVAGYKQWGQSMQQDIYDATDWLIAEGVVDPQRKCIVGASYGGYAALVASYQKPDEFRCVASIAGIPDLHEMVDHEARNPNRKWYVTEMIGDLSNNDEEKMLKEYSAINHLDKIAAPLLIIHGTEDTRVRVAQSRDFNKKAQAAGLDIQYLELEDGTHFLDEYNNRLAVFEALDGFLQQHL
jgi:dipeptidyl aminopeptidase/acylaminoacyl peptidase